MSDDREPRVPGCKCHWEIGDSPCPVHEHLNPDLDPRDAELARLRDEVERLTSERDALTRRLALDGWYDERVMAREVLALREVAAAARQFAWCEKYREDVACGRCYGCHLDATLSALDALPATGGT